MTFSDVVGEVERAGECSETDDRMDIVVVVTNGQNTYHNGHCAFLVVNAHSDCTTGLVLLPPVATAVLCFFLPCSCLTTPVLAVCWQHCFEHRTRSFTLLLLLLLSQASVPRRTTYSSTITFVLLFNLRSALYVIRFYEREFRPAVLITMFIWISINWLLFVGNSYASTISK